MSEGFGKGFFLRHLFLSMWLFKIVKVYTLCFSLLVVVKDPECQDLAIIGGKHYKWMSTQDSFDESRPFCQEISGDLVIIKNEMDFKHLVYSYGKCQ